jgi:retron-type reverse transcriptase
MNTKELTDERLKEDLFLAYYDARKHKRNTINQLKFEINFEQELFSLYDEIIRRTYKPRPSICFIISNPVKREVFAADFRDRVIHHLLHNYIGPVLERSFIPDSYSCRKGKGTLYGIKRVEQFVRLCSENYTKDCYILKLDIRGYFMNINKQILFGQLVGLLDKNKIAEAYSDNPQPDWELVFYLIREVIFQDVKENCIVKGARSDWEGLPPSKSLFRCLSDKGLPIGNLTSQLFSNVYMHVFDEYMTTELGLNYYGRYVDDFVIVHRDKEFLKGLIGLSKNFLGERLSLEVHPKKIYLQHYTKGVRFLGGVIKPRRLYVANRTLGHFKQVIRRYDCLYAEGKPGPDSHGLQMMRVILNSYLGIMRHFKCYTIKRKILFGKSHVFFNYGYFTKHLRKYTLRHETRTQKKKEET